MGDHVDFSKLMQAASENRQSSANKNSRYLVTKFKPPKKVSRQDAALSDNIKNFMAKKAEEERQKKEEAERQKRNLIEKRSEDSKAFKRIQLMKKSTKSASKSVMADAMDAQDPMDSMRQPDEDDYGFSSTTESAMYEKMMRGYVSQSQDKKTTPSKKPTSNLIATKARVREAFEREQMEAEMPHRRKRKQKSEESTTTKHSEYYDDYEEAPAAPVKPKKPPPPSLMNFNEMLRAAQLNRDRPMLDDDPVRPNPVKKPPEPSEPERLMTKKERREYLKEKEYLDRKAERAKTGGKSVPQVAPSTSGTTLGRIPKIPKKEPTSDDQAARASPRPSEKPSTSHDMKKCNGKPNSTLNKVPPKPLEKGSILEKRLTLPEKRPVVPEKSKPLLPSSSKVPPPKTGKPSGLSKSEPRREIEREKPLLPNKTLPKPQPANGKVPPRPATAPAPKSGQIRPAVQERGRLPVAKPTSSVPARPSGGPVRSEGRPLSAQAKPGPSRIDPGRPAGGPQRPPGAPERPPVVQGRPDGRPAAASGRPVNGSMRPGQRPGGPPMRRPVGGDYPRGPPMKRSKMAIPSDSESEVDSEMDDFIDDTPQENDLDLSSVLKNVFGYDKRKYMARDFDDDDECMESSYDQINKEEFISKKAGILEDLADIERKKRLKEAAKKRKGQR